MPGTSASFLLFLGRECIIFLGRGRETAFQGFFFRFDADYHLGQIFKKLPALLEERERKQILVETLLWRIDWRFQYSIPFLYKFSSLSLLPFSGFVWSDQFWLFAAVRDKGSAVHTGEPGWAGCLWVAPGAGRLQQQWPWGQAPLLAPGTSCSRHGAGERQSWLGWRQVLTSALRPAQPCSKQKSSWRRESEGSLKMARVVCGVTRLVLKAEHSLWGWCVVVPRNYPFIIMWTVLSVLNISLARLISSLNACWLVPPSPSHSLGSVWEILDDVG